MSGCSIDGCDGALYARGWCCKHYHRWADNGDPELLVGRRQGEAHPGWKGDRAGWPALRQRVNKQRGKAREFGCHHCERQARGWGYNGGTTGDPTDVMQWVPRCHGCRLL